MLYCRFIFVVAEALDIDDESRDRRGYNDDIGIEWRKKFVSMVVDDGLLLAMEFSVVDGQSSSFSGRNEM
jgi:hypothetical protein